MAAVTSLVSKYERISQQPPSSELTKRVRVKRNDMPLLQSTLSFSRLPAATADTTRRAPRAVKSSKQITPPAEDVDEDTIVVMVSEEPSTEGHDDAPLLTPSESVADISSASLDTPKIQSPVRSRPKRVSDARRTRAGKTVVERSSAAELGAEPSEKQRNISGDTLVGDVSLSQTSLIKDSVNKLDLAWNVSMELDKLGERQDTSEEQDEADDTANMIPSEEEQQDTIIKSKSSKRVKIEENNQKWDQRRKSSDKNATRRSSRASMLISKATEIVSDITATVLGKRSRSKEQEQRDTPSSESQPTTKKARFSTGNQAAEKQGDGVSLAATKRALKSRTPRDKKWLVSGLYAGQTRTFDPTKSESQNKRKSTGATQSAAAVPENSVLPLPMFAGARLLDQGRDFRLPFDVFSPLPPGQPKPDEWRRVNKNVFVGDAAAEWRTNKFSEQSTCICRPDTGCDSDCMNRFMYYECDSRNCNLTEEQCGNRAFEGLRKRVKAGGQYNVGVEVLRTADRGYGVRACRTFEPNQIIVEYTGEIINQEECESRMHGLYKDNECYYLMAFDQNMVIDATRGSIARFVNHSCAPNCRMEKWTVGGKPRMALFASDQSIMTGEELTYDYNFDPYSQKNVQVCRCGADNCRGVLGPKPKELPKKEKESTLAGAKRKIAEVLDEGKEMMTGNKRKKVEEKKKLPKGWVYLPPEEKPRSKKEKKSENEDQKKPKDVDGSLSRRPSKLKRIVPMKSKSVRSVKSISTTGSKKKRQGQRVTSTNSTSSGTALIPADPASVEQEEWEDAPEESARPVSKGSSRSKSSVATLEAKAGSIKSKVGRSSRGR